MRRRLTPLLGAIAVLAPAAPALADDRYAAPSATGDCSQADPCSLTTAVTGAADGDRVLLTGGPYPFTATLEVDRAITVRPAGDDPIALTKATPGAILQVTAGATLQRLQLTGPDTVLEVTATATDAQLGGISVTQSGGTGPAADLAAPGLFAFGFTAAAAPGGTGIRVAGEDARVAVCDSRGGAVGVELTTESTLELCRVQGAAEGVRMTGGDPRVVNSRVVSDAGVAVRATGVAGADLLHVTALAGESGTALRADGSARVLVRNSILEAGGDDVDAGDADVTFDHVNAGGAEGVGVQEASPQLDAEGRPQPGSPVVDAGVADARIGSVDLDGAARVSGCAPDLGAFELQTACVAPPPPPPPPPPAPPVVVQQQPVQLPGLLVGDFTDPVLRALQVRVDARRRLVATLTGTEPMIVRFVVEKRVDGRRAGGRCVRGARKGKRCSRWVVVRRVTRRLQDGEQRARLGSAPLSRGVYRITARGQDAARNPSPRRRDTVRVRAKRG